MKTGSQSKIYKKYVPFLVTFLQNHARYDIDGDGLMWCKKEELIAFLSDVITDDDANAIAHTYCCNNAKYAEEMLDLIRRGKEYICHRLYNQGFVKNIERRKIKRNIAYIRLLRDYEKPTPPQPDSVYLMKRMFIQQNELTPDVALKIFMESLNSQLFDADAKLAEWNRVLAKLIRQGCLVFKNGVYTYTHIRRGSVYEEAIRKSSV